MSRAILRISGNLGAVCLGLWLLAGYTPLASWWGAYEGTASRVRPAGAVVVLGKGQFDDGSLDNASYRRTVEGVALYQRGLARYVVLLGASRLGEVAETQARYSLAQSLGVPADKILTESRGKTTQEEAALSWKLLGPRQIRSILLVTDSQHMTRAARLFEQAGFDVAPAVANEYSLPAMSAESRIDTAQHIAAETLARLYHWREGSGAR